MKSTPALLAILALSLSGCEIFYGVSRSARLPTAPEAECVANSIAHTPGIVAVERLRPPEETASGRMSYAFQYQGAVNSHIRGFVQLRSDGPHHTVFEQSRMDWNKKVPQEDIDATRPVMAAIERGIERDCNVRGLSRGIRETCYRTPCKPLPPP